MKIKIGYSEAMDLLKLLNSWDRAVDDDISDGSLGEVGVKLAWHHFAFETEVVLDFENGKEVKEEK